MWELAIQDVIKLLLNNMILKLAYTILLLTHRAHRSTGVAVVAVQVHIPRIEVQAVRVARGALVERRRPVETARTHEDEIAFFPMAACKGKENRTAINTREPSSVYPILGSPCPYRCAVI